MQNEIQRLNFWSTYSCLIKQNQICVKFVTKEGDIFVETRPRVKVVLGLFVSHLPETLQNFCSVSSAHLDLPVIHLYLDYVHQISFISLYNCYSHFFLLFSCILAYNYVIIIQPFAFLKRTAIHGACLLFYEFYIYVQLNIFIWYIFIISFPFLQFFQDPPHLHRHLTS